MCPAEPSQTEPQLSARNSPDLGGRHHLSAQSCESSARPDHSLRNDHTDSNDYIDARGHRLPSIAASLPTELVQHIYAYLDPFDFNSARHTCRTWMYASIQAQLLALQVRRGGWWASAGMSSVTTRDALAMNRRLLHECSLADDRTFHRCRRDPGKDFPEVVEQEQPLESPVFSNRAPKSDTSSRNESHVCTTSLCGNYFLSASGSRLHVWRVSNHSMGLISRVECENTVIAMAIDVSMDKMALAIVLEGRSGLYIDLSPQVKAPHDESPWEVAGTIISTGRSPAPILDLRTTDCVGNVIRDVLSIHGDSFSAAQLHVSALWPETINISQALEDTTDNTQSRRLAVYRSVCTTEDPPLSVAIGPNSHCVAFGCKNGVELYWIDQITGQNLNRWFRLSHPSHHLYFLPPRRLQDSPSRLRLISTARSMASVSDQRTPDAGTTASVSTWFTLRASWRTPGGHKVASQTLCPDHSHAVPMSDGHHILFIDNDIGMLCVGSDQPNGFAQRLSRKFVLEPPSSRLSASQRIPDHFASSANTGSGVRVVASYGNEVILYSLPADALKYSTAEQEQTLLVVDERDHADILNHPMSTARTLREAGLDSGNSLRLDSVNMTWVRYSRTAYQQMGSIWPLHLTGVIVGSFEAVESLAIHDSRTEGLIVWAFSGTRRVVKSWHLADSCL